MIEGLDDVLKGSGQPGLSELRGALHELLGGREARGALIAQQCLKLCVYRLRFTIDGQDRALVVKRMDPDIARRNQLIAQRWLPAIGLGRSGSPFLGAAAERGGECVWHIYEDLGDWTLAACAADQQCVRAAMELIARIHVRFADHALLGECRLWGGDLGIHFYTSNVRDAISSLNALRPPTVALAAEHEALRDRLLERLHQLRAEQPMRALALAELGGPETLLHGDLWLKNLLLIPSYDGLAVRLIDWDHAAVGPLSYDLSTLLMRFPLDSRRGVLNYYRVAIAEAGWRLPSESELNLLFETAELARIANRVIWPAIAAFEGDTGWGLDALASIEQWFETLQPVLPLAAYGGP